MTMTVGRSARCAVASAALVIVVSACGSEGLSGTSSDPTAGATSAAAGTSADTTTTSASATSAAPGSERPVDEQPASNGPRQSVDLSKVLPRAGDLPASYTAVRATPPDAGDARAARDLRRCTGAPDHESAVRETRLSPVFAIEPASVGATARSYDSQEAAYQNAAVLRDDEKSPTCLRKSVAHAITAHRSGSEAITVHSVSVSVTVGTGGGVRNQQGAVYATADVTSGGVRTVLYITTMYLVGPRVSVELTFTRTGEQFDNNLLQSVTRRVAARAADGD